MECIRNSRVKTCMLFVLFLSVILQCIGLATPTWGCISDGNDLCSFEGLFQTCQKGTCVEKVRYKGMASLAMSSFFINVTCVLIWIFMLWSTYRSAESTGTVEECMRQKWTMWWKLIAVLLFISNLLSCIVLFLGVRQYDKVSTLIAFSLCGVVTTLTFGATLLFSLFYYGVKFVEFFTS